MVMVCAHFFEIKRNIFGLPPEVAKGLRKSSSVTFGKVRKLLGNFQK